MQSYDTNRRPSRPRAGLYNSLPKPTSASLIYAGIGAAVGLILGLIFAWMVWPVQWTNAWPADLSQEARAQYLAAVSEAYVYYGDAEAAEVARNRLFNLNDDLATYIADAQKFFVDNPQANSRVYINNLGQLAQALNIQSPDIIIETPVDSAAATDGSTADTTSANVGDGVRAWVNWALMVLAAIILVGGGFYVVARLNQRRLATAEGDTLDDGGFDDEPGSGYVRPAPASDRTAQTNPYMRPMRGTGGAPIPTSVPPRSAPQRQSEDYGFDDDDSDDELYTRGAPSRALDYRSDDEIFDDAMDDDLLDDSLDAPLADPLDDAIDSPQDHYTSTQSGVQTANPQAFYTPRRPLAVEDDPGAGLEDELEDEDSPPAATLVPPVTKAAPPPTTNRGTAGVRTLNTYTFQYHAGIPDYDQSRPIVDPETGLQVGDCGMGVNLKNNIVQNNPDNVIALDVWLVDKKQEKSFSSQDRVLLSEYVIDHNLEQTFTRERPNDPSPIIPQPGTTFQIKGPSLTLDCVVTEVSYIKNNAAAGMFQSLSIDMTVRSRS
jgi:hypothetical protein